MKITFTQDLAAGVVRILLEVSATANPETVADFAWSAVDDTLTRLQQEPAR